MLDTLNRKPTKWHHTYHVLVRFKIEYDMVCFVLRCLIYLRWFALSEIEFLVCQCTRVQYLFRLLAHVCDLFVFVLIYLSSKRSSLAHGYFVLFVFSDEMFSLHIVRVCYDYALTIVWDLWDLLYLDFVCVCFFASNEASATLAIPMALFGWYHSCVFFFFLIISFAAPKIMYTLKRWLCIQINNLGCISLHRYSQNFLDKKHPSQSKTKKTTEAENIYRVNSTTSHRMFQKLMTSEQKKTITIVTTVTIATTMTTTKKLVPQLDFYTWISYLLMMLLLLFFVFCFWSLSGFPTKDNLM